MVCRSVSHQRGKSGLGPDVISSKKVRQKVLVLGAGLFAEEIADVISSIPGYELIGFVEGLDRQRCGRSLLGLPVHWIEDVGTLRDACRAVCAVGSPQRDGFIRQAQERGLAFLTVAHPSAQVFPTVTLGEGCLVGAGVVVGAHTVVGKHVILNRGALIGHHVHIGDYATISPGANIAGKTTIGTHTYVGMGAIILDGISIGSRCLVAAGAVVTRNVPDGTRVMGVPARAQAAKAEGGKPMNESHR